MGSIYGIRKNASLATLAKKVREYQHMIGKDREMAQPPWDSTERTARERQFSMLSDHYWTLETIANHLERLAKREAKQ